MPVLRNRTWWSRVAVIVGLMCVSGAWLTGFAQTGPALREAAKRAQDAHNWKVAYDGYRTLALDPKTDAKIVPADLQAALDNLHRLGREEEGDDLLEASIAAHATNWRLLARAARLYQQHIQHQGFIVAGKFYRGHKRGGQGQFVNAMARDRARALQLFQQALPLAMKDDAKAEVAGFLMDFATAVSSVESWRLQALSDLSKLPDYDDQAHFGWGGRGMYYPGGGGAVGAPVDADGNPVYHQVPAAFEKSASDGERWRWLLSMVVELVPSRRSEVDMLWAQFCQGQFGESTLAAFGGYFGGQEDDPKAEKTGTFALHTLSDSETIAKLATGVKRFKLPDEHNYIKIYQLVADRENGKPGPVGGAPAGRPIGKPAVKGIPPAQGGHGANALQNLAAIFANRRQYVKSADVWKRVIAEYGPGENAHRQKSLDQIVKNWGRIENVPQQPAGKGATFEYRFRNGAKVAFEAHKIHVGKLLDDVKTYLKSSPNQLDHRKLNIQEIGYRLVVENQTQYVGERVWTGSLDLKPRPAHVDDRVTVSTPLQNAGAYLLTAKMDNGNTSRVIIWLNDTAIIKKALTSQSYYFVANAATGKPIERAEIEFFGWKQIQVQPNKNLYKVVTTNFAERVDADGQLRLGQNRLPQDNQWLIIARGPAGEMGYLGFSHVWYNQYYDHEYNETKVFTITDRPVYRPNQTVKFKFWIAHAKYDQEDTLNPWGKKKFPVQISNPKGEIVQTKTYESDVYGGLEGEYVLPKDATLGVYGVHIANHPQIAGGGSFRVEEYKKPEYEVLVEAPTEPVMLGEKITASIKAKYYFGAPVTKARVKYKVMRSTHSEHWYPVGDWDWFYGRGYWWFGYNYTWYPGWREWGCERPSPWWWGTPGAPPEVVAERETDIGADGTVAVEIDTALAKEMHGNHDHQYSVTAEVIDESRRTIVGTGNVLVARQPFKVFTWVDRGHYRTGDVVQASFQAHTLDQKPVAGKGVLSLYHIEYDPKTAKPTEKVVETWNINTNDEGRVEQKLKAGAPGQYRLAYKLTDAKGHEREGAYVFVVTGAGFDGHQYRFNDIEIVTDKKEYAAGDKVRLMLNTNRSDAAVVLFIRPANGVYLPPKVIRLKGKSTVEEFTIDKRDMPNFFVEAFTVANAKLYEETKEIVVPPEKRVLNVTVLPSKKEYKPGAPATMEVRLTDFHGKPFVGQTVLTMYDKSVEYISGGSNVPDIKDFFWKWRRHHHPQSESNLGRWFYELLKPNETGMGYLGLFGHSVVEELNDRSGALLAQGKADGGMPVPTSAPMMEAASGFAGGMGGGGGGIGGPAKGMRAGIPTDSNKDVAFSAADPGAGAAPLVEAAVRKNFADSAFWAGAVVTNNDGVASIALTMPEQLTAWKLKCWAMGTGTKVGEGSVEVTTSKNLLVRLQAPRFFVQKDEVVLSANVHNYLKTEKLVTVSLEMDGQNLVPMGSATQQVRIPANGEQRVDWRVKVSEEGMAVVRMKALSDEESDAMEMKFPCYVHGMLKMESWSGVIRPDKSAGAVSFKVPAERRINDSRLEVRFSPTLAGAMVDALPYLVDYPYGCTEQTLNRFLPTVITQRILQRMNLNLKDIQTKRTNLNAQEIGDDRERAKGWKRYGRNPVFDVDEVASMTKDGLQRLTEMQLSDGGWGWFSGYGEHSWPHTTAVVVHGLQIAKQNDLALVPNVLERGVEWLKRYQAEQVQWLKNATEKKEKTRWKSSADNLDAFVYMILVDADVANNDMLEFLYRDRAALAVYGKALFGLALHKQKQADKLKMILENIAQFVVQDDENQTAYLKLPHEGYWWYWYGSEIESHAYYLKLLAKTDPKGDLASRLVKYLLNNRKHATYWNSTRDTAVAIEALADFMKESGEESPDMTVELYLDGKKQKEVKITRENLFTFDNKLVLTGDAVETGEHKVELRRQGKGPVYFNTYLTNFTLEDFITKAGLEVKVNRKYYKLTKADKSVNVAGSRGQVVSQKVEKYDRTELANLSTLKSGDLVEIELEIDSKNDYEYVIFEDMKAAGFEPVEVRSGYNGNPLGAFIEFRDEKVCFFVRQLARGKSSVSYRLKAEIPGKFSALPTRAYAMYAPELKGNSDEIKLHITD